MAIRARSSSGGWIHEEPGAAELPKGGRRLQVLGRKKEKEEQMLGRTYSLAALAAVIVWSGVSVRYVEARFRDDEKKR